MIKLYTEEKKVTKCAECPCIEKQYTKDDGYIVDIAYLCNNVEKIIQVVDVVEFRNGKKNEDFTEIKLANQAGVFPEWCILKDYNK